MQAVIGQLLYYDELFLHGYNVTSNFLAFI